MKIVFLYTEIASYTLACLKGLLDLDAEIVLYRYPVNKEAPFNFKNISKLKIYDRNNLSLNTMITQISEFNPQLIFCSGWIDKEYLKICKYFRDKKIKTVLCLDNQWKFSLKKVLAVLASPIFIKRNFEMVWVPGKSQRKFASKLGFAKNKIYEGFYSADTSYYEKVFENCLPQKRINFPKRFIYIGRYYEFKGLKELWSAFASFSVEFPEWELWCIGTGDLFPMQHEKIKHFGFIQPEKLHEFLSQTGVFVLPSRFEPWGVVVHEMAAGGFPLILSDAVGAAEAFLQENENGISYKKESTDELKSAFIKIATSSTEDLIKMGEKSNILSKVISLSSWVDTVKNMLNT